MFSLSDDGYPLRLSFTFRVMLHLTCVFLILHSVSAYGFPDCQKGVGAKWPICDSSLPPSVRAADLVSRMNITERILRLGYSATAFPHLGLPDYNFGTEALHGVASGTQFTQSGVWSSSSLFPTPINSAATFDRSLWNHIATWISNEARAFNNAGRTGLHFWAPNINIVRDPRWGRAHETSGEDPYLTGQYALQYVRGMQEGVDGRYLKVVSTCKHWLAYDLETGDAGVDRHHFNAQISDLDLAETQLPAFESCVRDAKAQGIMCSYNEVNGVPTCALPLFEQTVLRDEWGFRGTIVSDCGAIEDISDTHHYSTDPVHAVAAGLTSGTDMECQFGPIYYQVHGLQALNAGLITEQQINIAVERAYGTLIRLGYFDDAAAQPYRQMGSSFWNTTEAHQVSLQAAKESLVLLKNDQSSLPILTNQLKVIAVIGHAANESLLGPYIVRSPYDIHILNGISSAAAARGVRVEYALGAYIAGNDTSHFKEAVNLASTADLVIFVGGTNQTVSEEGRDQTSLALPGVQLQLIQQLEKVSKQPLITIMIGGVSTDISYLKRSSSVGSILWAGYPGMDAGTAVASVLFGEFSPAGRLPITIYPADYANQVQMSNMAMRPTTSPAYPGRTYKFYTGEPVFPFGYGLSYTTFTYTFPSSMQQQQRSHNVQHLAQQYTQGGLHLSSPAVDFHYIVNVTNSGSVRSDLVVLAFLSSTVDESAADAAASPPISALVDFAHLHQLEPGQSVEVAFSLQFRALAHVDVDGHSWLLPGEYRLTIGQGEHAEHLGQNGEQSAVTFILNLSGAPQLIHRHTSLQPPMNQEAKASFRAQDDSEKISIHAD